ncbi:MAG: helix-turn-helix transcriptional regulator [Spirochaetes bacterium]|nr:helix-turn-helix transcriptional regulator [Spirochaetota bacterium]
MKTKLDPFFRAFHIPDVDVDTLSRTLAAEYFSANAEGETLTARGRNIRIVPNVFAAEQARTVTPTAHRHLFLEIILIVEGNGVFEHNGIELMIQKGDIVFVGHYLLHRIKRAEKAFSYIGIRFVPEALENSATISGQLTVTAFRIFDPFYPPDSASPVLHLTGASFSRMLIHFLQVVHAFSQASKPRDHLIAEFRALMAAVITERGSVDEAHTHDGSLAAVFAYIREHVAERLSLAALAETAGMSRTSLSVKFNRMTGMSLPNYINELRIEQAKQLLASSRLSVSAIAERTGFASDSFFIREFKKRVRATPQTFRERSVSAR